MLSAVPKNQIHEPQIKPRSHFVFYFAAICLVRFLPVHKSGLVCSNPTAWFISILNG